MGNHNGPPEHFETPEEYGLRLVFELLGAMFIGIAFLVSGIFLLRDPTSCAAGTILAGSAGMGLTSAPGFLLRQIRR